MLQRGLSFGIFSLASELGVFQLNLMISFVVALSISFASEALTYPFSVLMRRMMIQSGHSVKAFSSPWACLKMTL